MNTSNIILNADKISFHYQEDIPILKDISFSIKEGESLGVLGPNGGGKSTLLKIIVGLLKATSGNLEFYQKPIQSFKKYPFHLFSYVPQNNEINTILPLKVSEFMDFHYALFLKSTSLLTVDEILNEVGVLHKKDFLLTKLSGGEKQRVLLARALINRPKLLILDEPTKGLDMKGQDQLLEIIEKIKSINQMAVIIVDHNINQMIRNCHKILCLNQSFHWHDHKELLTKNILEDIYHCEFEHLLIHESGLSSENHFHCQDNHLHGLKSHLNLRNKK